MERHGAPLDTANAAHCVPSAPSPLSSLSLSSSAVPPFGSAATYTPTSGSVSFPPPPSVSPLLPPSSSTTEPLPTQSVSPCGQLVQDPNFSAGLLHWPVSASSNGAIIQFQSGPAVCGARRTACAQLVLGPTTAATASIAVAQTIDAPGAIVSGANYQIYVTYRASTTAPASIHLMVEVDSIASFPIDLTPGDDNQNNDGYRTARFNYAAQSTALTVALVLTGSKDMGAAGFDAAVQIGEVNLVGCRSATTSSLVPRGSLRGESIV
ncbi:MAG: hypothetical protein STHCBS139747_007008 [Sporothrix thermara]